MSKQKQDLSARRNFLRGGVVAGAGVAVASTLPGAAMASSDTTEEKPQQPENYRLTKHINDYYKSTV